jgi:nucleotide-binding universal stress UspA family protein
MFAKILHANDGSEHAFHALSLALAVAKQNNSELHMVSVEEIDYLPEFIEEVREETGTAARRWAVPPTCRSASLPLPLAIPTVWSRP